MDWSSIIFGVFLGLVLLPVIYDVGLYLVMRSEFLVWHGVRAVAITVMALSAMSVTLPPALDGEQMRWLLQVLATDLSIAVSGPFLVAYVEKGTISPRLATALRMTFPVTVMSTILLIGTGANPIIDYSRNALFLVVLVLLIAGLVQALRRGSRAARYQALAWSAVFGVCAYALFFELVLMRGMENWMEAILAAIAVEIVVTATGIADRFMVLKQERDEAVSRERKAREDALTDPLTGLRNRRGLANRFAATDRDPVNALAIVDVDFFKRINDGFGHDVGDDVLVAVAQALQGEGRFVARIGGEEFAVLLFNEHWREDAENIRKSVESTVRSNVPSVPMRVTASAGVVQNVAHSSFAQLMRTADDALYRAKSAGRDRLEVTDDRGSSAPAQFVAA